MTNSSSKLQRYLISFTTCAAIAILTACGGSNSGSTTSTNSTPIYTAVFDAGSSGTRLSFFKVTPGNGGYPTIEKIITLDDKTNGIPNDDGINDFILGNGSISLKGEPLPAGCPGTSKLGQTDVQPCVLQPLLQELDKAVAAQNVSDPKLNLTISKVKVELFATAGMRTVDQKNGGPKTTAQILEYYDQMKTYVSNWGYAAGEFKTINGNSEEGLWTWINLNDYYFNIFGGNPTVSKTAQNPVGDFEVGGSSMQIAFPVNESPSDSNNIYPVSINGKSFNVYSKTFLGLGGDDARKYVKAFNYNSNNGGSNCYSSAAEPVKIKESSGIALYPSSQVSYLSYPFPTNTGVNTLPWTELTASQLDLNVSATYNFDGCSNSYDSIVNQVTSLTRNNDGTMNEGSTATMTSLRTKLQSSTVPFVGTDNFYYSADDLGYKPSTGFDSATFTQALKTFCNGAVASEEANVQNACPNGTFMNSYLFGTTGLFTNSTATFAGVLNPSNASGETVLTWTRGYLLLKYAN
jgi:hypothetical protein